HGGVGLAAGEELVFALEARGVGGVACGAAAVRRRAAVGPVASPLGRLGAGGHAAVQADVAQRAALRAVAPDAAGAHPPAVAVPRRFEQLLDRVAQALGEARLEFQARPRLLAHALALGDEPLEDVGG